jgi:hypothetical protein
VGIRTANDSALSTEACPEIYVPKMRRRVQLALAVAAVGCTPSTSSPPPKPAVTPAPADTSTTASVGEAPSSAPQIAPGYVLLWDWTELRSAPSADAERAQATVTNPESRPRPTSRVWVMRAVRQDGDWLEVETIADSDAHCVPDKWQLDNFALRLFVRAEDAILLTTRTVEAQLSNGNVVIFGAGLPVVAGTPDHIIASVVWPFEVPDDALGHSYPAPGRRDQGPHATGTINPEALRIQDDFTLPSSLATSVLEVRELDGDWAMATVADGCVEYRLRIAKSEYDPSEPDVWGGLSGSMRDAQSMALPANTTLTWPDGSAAGTTRAEHLLEAESLVLETDDGRRCFEHMIDYAEPVAADPGLTLCFDARVAGGE